MESNVNCRTEEEIYFYNLGKLSDGISNRMAGPPQDEIHNLFFVGKRCNTSFKMTLQTSDIILNQSEIS